MSPLAPSPEWPPAAIVARDSAALRSMGAPGIVYAAVLDLHVM